MMSMMNYLKKKIKKTAVWSIISRLKKKISDDKMGKANIEICGDVITVCMEGTYPENTTFCYYLYDINNKIVEKSKWVKESNYSFSVIAEGAYLVKVFKKENLVKSVTLTSYVDYYNEQTISEFETYCNKKSDYELIKNVDPDYFYHMQYPYKDFAIIAGMSPISSAFLEKYRFGKRDIAHGNWCTQIISETGEPNQISDMIFSGLAKHNDLLISGEKDITDCVNISDDNIGNFTYVKVNKSEIEVGNDYFGTGKIYYFKENNQYIISNNYHLLLLILKDLKIKVEMNNKLIMALLCKGRQAFQQSITREREIINAFMLPADELIVIGSKGVLFKKKSISSVFKMKKQNSIAKMEKLLEEGKKEIIDNTKIVFEDNRYDKVLVDLTGGLDSRSVYGAVCNLPQFRDKIVIHSDGYDSYVNSAFNQENSDLSLAIKLNCLNKFKYNDIGVVRTWMDVDTAQNQMISQGTLSGYFYPHSTVKMITKNKDKTPAFELNGFYGEICCRPYYARSLMEKREKYVDMGAFISAIANRSGILSGSTYEALKEVLAEELLLLPGNDLLEKWELHYLFYRNGLHCNTIWEYEKRTPQWGPLQSKALFKYKHLTFGQIMGATQQLKLLQMLDERLNLVPYANSNDEEERKIFLNSCKNLKHDDVCERESVEEERKKWQECRKEKRANSTEQGIDGNNYKEYVHKGEEFDEDLAGRILEMLHKLMSYDSEEFKRLFGISVFWNIQEKRLNSNEMKTLYQKLLAIYVHVQLLRV